MATNELVFYVMIWKIRTILQSKFPKKYNLSSKYIYQINHTSPTITMKAPNPSPNDTRLKHHNKKAEELPNTLTIKPQSSVASDNNLLLNA